MSTRIYVLTFFVDKILKFSEEPLIEDYKNFFESILNEIEKGTDNPINPSEYSPLVLAYIGDTVYEVFVRTLVVSYGNAPVNKLHNRSVKFVKAKAQSNILHEIEDILTTYEQDVVRRGRNAKSGYVPKNADLTEYRYATAFECLVGYLYLKKDYERLMFILKKAVEKISLEEGKRN